MEKLLADKSFYLPSPLAAAAVATAKLLKQWLHSTENIRPATAFSDSLVASLKYCFPCHSDMRVRRENMWGNIHQLRSSDSFQSMWSTVLRKCAAEEASPTFFQYITDVIFRDMIKHEFRLISTNQDSSEAPLSYLEKNALRYTAGYVTRHLHKQLQCSAHPQKAELQLCLLDFSDSDISTDDSEWVRSIDRSGLKHVNDMTYMLLILVHGAGGT